MVGLESPQLCAFTSFARVVGIIQSHVPVIQTEFSIQNLGKLISVWNSGKMGALGGRSKKPILSFPTRDPSEVK